MPNNVRVFKCNMNNKWFNLTLVFYFGKGKGGRDRGIKDSVF